MVSSKLILPTAQLVAAALVGERLRHGVRRIPALEPLSAPTVNISVVIPARNEARRIVGCVQSVLEHVDATEVIVVDDSSTDHTAEWASVAGATVVAAPPLPQGWVGKPWALQQGLEHATGDVVIFLDADTTVNKGLSGAIFEALKTADVVTLSSCLVTNSPMEQALSASMVTTLVYRFGPVGRRTPPRPDRVTGNGQCLAVRREWFINEGGFSLAAHNMTDDIALLRAVATRGARVAFLDGSKLVSTQMYSSAWQTLQQWPRSLPMNDVTSGYFRVLDGLTLWFTMAIPLIRVFSGRATIVDKALLAQRVAISGALASSYKKPNKWVWLSPLLDPLVLLRMTWTTVRPVRSWRGRVYAPPKTADQ